MTKKTLTISKQLYLILACNIELSIFQNEHLFFIFSRSWYFVVLWYDKSYIHF